MTGGTFTIGPTLGQYPNLAAAKADVTGALTADLTLRIVENYTESFVVAFGTIDLNGKTITIEGDIPHNGNPDSGRIVSWSSTSPLIDFSNPPVSVAGSKFVVSNINFRSLAADCRSAVQATLFSSPNAVSVVFRDLIADYRAVPLAVSYGGISFQCDAPHDIKIFNCLVLNFKSSAQEAAFFLKGIGTVENCVALGSAGVAYGFWSFSFTGTIRNCVSLSSGGAAFFGQSTATGRNNMADDASVADASWSDGTGNIPSVTPLAEFTSITPGAGFLIPTQGGSARAGGSAVSIVENDHGIYLSSPRPHGSSYSIGIHEWAMIPIVTGHPVTQYVAVGGTAPFTVTADCATGYQWQEKPSGTAVWADIVGATLSSYSYNPVIVDDHYTKVRCVVVGEGGSAVTSSAFVLVIGESISAETPERPNASIVSVVDRTITISVSGIADVYRGELLDQNYSLAAYGERDGNGDFTILVPSRGVRYMLVVVAGNSGSPIVWSLPGLSTSITIPPLPISSLPEEGVGLVKKPSTEVENAGPMGAGLAFPFHFSELTGAPATSSGVQHVVEGMTQILLTPINSRVIRRNFGSPVAGKLFAPDTELSQDIAAALQSSIAENEHRAEVTNIIFKRDRTKGKLFADIKFRTFRTHQSGNLVYPFDMTVA